METVELLLAYLEETTGYLDISLDDYYLNGSIIKLTYSYCPRYDWDNAFINYGNILEVPLLDYITWIFNSNNK